MIRSVICFLSLLFFSSSAAAGGLPRVLMQTTMGDMEIELYADKAPVTVENFLHYVKDGFYNGTIFHRVVYGWLIQGGGYNENLQAKETRAPIKNEAANGLKNRRGTIAMARFSDPDSADSQFFINLDDNTSFDHRGRTPDRYGYCVFGRVVKGMDVADAISDVDKVEKEGFGSTFPARLIVIKDVKILNGD
jgi:cyclophilin family peptidyl-prolyl cis-trans isomerase